MVLDLLRRLFGGGKEITSFEELRPGKAVLRGTIKAGDEQVRSPLKGLGCVAYYYKASYKAQARGKWVERVVKDAEVYAPSFGLALEGGTIRVLPPRGVPLDPQEHRQLQARGFPGFQATEQLIRPGTLVKLEGSVQRDGEGFVLRLRRIDLVPEAEQQAGPYKRPERRRRKKR
ncbi:MAG: hypothetical protein JXB32_01980 [Deltaproteobacteria bacterium]|nr:hypothetical protein [Deltaproteobacteria bacterium]